jgi:prolyl-tRNA synthetase
VVIIPIYKGNDGAGLMKPVATNICERLRKKGISVKYDDRDTQKPGWKFADYELKGIPVRIAIGPRDIENNTVEVARRDTLEKVTINVDSVDEYIPSLLEDIQKNIYNRALKFREENTYYTDDWDEFTDIIENRGGFVMAHFDGTRETEEEIKNRTKATVRCIPLDSPDEKGKCILTGKPSERRVLFARAY